MTSDEGERTATRRYVLQALGSAGAAGLAGCMGGDSDQDSESTDTVDQTPEQTEDPGPDYSVPESEHMDLGQMARDWGSIFPNGNIANGWSPSQMYHDIADTTWIGGESAVIYDIFDFNADDIPETFAQQTYVDNGNTEGLTEIKVDQIPGDTTSNGLEQDLLDAGFEKKEEDGEFSIYTNPSRSEARALNEDYHIASFPGSTHVELSIEHIKDRLSTVINHYNSEEMQMNDHARDALDRIDVDDYLAVTSTPASNRTRYSMVNTFPPEKLPLAGALTVDTQESTKKGVWKFGEGAHAEAAYDMLTGDQNQDFEGARYDSIELDGEYIIATGDNRVFEDHTHIHPVVPTI